MTDCDEPAVREADLPVHDQVGEFLQGGDNVALALNDDVVRRRPSVGLVGERHWIIGADANCVGVHGQSPDVL